MSQEYTKPSVVIVSSSNTKPQSLIKLITHSPAIASPSNPDLVTQEWEIKTKYYTANVNLFGITEDFLRSKDFNNSVQALIIHMDSNKESGLSDLEKWADIDTDCDVEVKLLVANYFTSGTKVSKAEATKWCLERGFELIELYPNTENSVEESDYNDIIKEKTGIDRVIEALQAHVWPNLIMTASNYDQDDQKISSLKSNFDPFDKTLTELLTNDGLDDFAELVSKLNMFKESLSTMPSNQRKQNAEQLVTKFWQAIGGDEEELADV